MACSASEVLQDVRPRRLYYAIMLERLLLCIFVRLCGLKFAGWSWHQTKHFLMCSIPSRGSMSLFCVAMVYAEPV